VDQRVSDRIHADALALFGEQGSVDLIGINGYAGLPAMVLNAAPLPALKPRRA
jgi:4-carboxymuconolactone decarboxylase